MTNFERDVEMSSIMEINQSSFLSDGGKNILSEVNVQPSKQLKREKSKKNQALKSLERMKNFRCFFPNSDSSWKAVFHSVGNLSNIFYFTHYFRNVTKVD